MSDDDKTDAGPDQIPVPGVDTTMQIDGFSEILESAEAEAFAAGAVEAEVLDEGGAEDEAEDEAEGEAALPPEERAGTAPPPLPPRRPGRTAIIVGVAVVVVAAGLGIAFGELLTGGDAEPAVGGAAEGSETAASPTPDEQVPEPTPIQLDTVVIGTEAGGSDDEGEPAAPEDPAE